MEYDVLNKGKHKEEHVICAAIWYQDGKKYEHQPSNVESGYVVCGRRHFNCVATTILLSGSLPVREIRTDGFLTSKDRFLNRVEANDLAIKMKQVYGNCEGDELISEDLY